MNKSKSTPILTAALFASALFLAMPDTVAEAVRRALSIAATRVLPSVFPYAVLSSIFVAAGGVDAVDRLFGGVFEKLFGTNRGASALLLGLLFGFPLGAYVIGAQHRAGVISTRTASVLMSFVCCASPTYPVFVVGGTFFGSVRAGIVIWITQAVSSVVVGVFACRALGVRGVHGKSTPTAARVQSGGGSAFALITSAIADASRVMLNVCGSVTFFSLCAAVANKALAPLSPPAAIRAAIGAVFEFSTGAANATALMSSGELPRPIALAAAGFAVGFSGLSVIFQNASVSDGVPLLPHFIGKLAVGIATAAVSYAFSVSDERLPSAVSICAAAAACAAVTLAAFIWRRKMKNCGKRGCKTGGEGV